LCVRVCAHHESHTHKSRAAIRTLTPTFIQKHERCRDILSVFMRGRVRLKGRGLTIELS
jgi:hypothetical protein